jgi:hypothetical protein
MPPCHSRMCRSALSMMARYEPARVTCSSSAVRPAESQQAPREPYFVHILRLQAAVILNSSLDRPSAQAKWLPRQTGAPSKSRERISYSSMDLRISLPLHAPTGRHGSLLLQPAVPILQARVDVMLWACPGVGNGALPLNETGMHTQLADKGSAQRTAQVGLGEHIMHHSRHDCCSRLDAVPSMLCLCTQA